MPLRATPDQASQRWQQGLANATQRIQEGVDSVTQAPGQKAAANKQGYLNGVTSMADEWARRTGAVSLGEWQTATKAAVSRVADGASRKAGKYQDRVTPVFAHMQSVLSRVDSMPTATIDQRINKSGEFLRGMAQYKKRTGG